MEFHYTTFCLFTDLLLYLLTTRTLVRHQTACHNSGLRSRPHHHLTRHWLTQLYLNNTTPLYSNWVMWYVSGTGSRPISEQTTRPECQTNYYNIKIVQWCVDWRYLDVITRLFSCQPVYQPWASITALVYASGSYRLRAWYGDRYENMWSNISK